MFEVDWDSNFASQIAINETLENLEQTIYYIKLFIYKIKGLLCSWKKWEYWDIPNKQIIYFRFRFSSHIL